MVEFSTEERSAKEARLAAVEARLRQLGSMPGADVTTEEKQVRLAAIEKALERGQENERKSLLAAGFNENEVLMFKTVRDRAAIEFGSNKDAFIAEAYAALQPTQGEQKEFAWAIDAIWHGIPQEKTAGGLGYQGYDSGGVIRAGLFDWGKKKGQELVEGQLDKEIQKRINQLPFYYRWIAKILYWFTKRAIGKQEPAKPELTKPEVKPGEPAKVGEAKTEAEKKDVGQLAHELRIALVLKAHEQWRDIEKLQEEQKKLIAALEKDPSKSNIDALKKNNTELEKVTKDYRESTMPLLQVTDQLAARYGQERGGATQVAHGPVGLQGGIHIHNTPYGAVSGQPNVVPGQGGYWQWMSQAQQRPTPERQPGESTLRDGMKATQAQDAQLQKQPLNVYFKDLLGKPSWKRTIAIAAFAGVAGVVAGPAIFGAFLPAVLSSAAWGALVGGGTRIATSLWETRKTNVERKLERMRRANPDKDVRLVESRAGYVLKESGKRAFWGALFAGIFEGTGLGKLIRDYSRPIIDWIASSVSGLSPISFPMGGKPTLDEAMAALRKEIQRNTQLETQLWWSRVGAGEILATGGVRATPPIDVLATPVDALPTSKAPAAVDLTSTKTPDAVPVKMSAVVPEIPTETLKNTFQFSVDKRGIWAIEDIFKKRGINDPQLLRWITDAYEDYTQDGTGGTRRSSYLREGLLKQVTSIDGVSQNRIRGGTLMRTEFLFGDKLVSNDVLRRLDLPNTSLSPEKVAQAKAVVKSLFSEAGQLISRSK